MVFTQGRGFVIGASSGLPHCPLRWRVLVCHAADTASLATRFLFGKLIGVAALSDFGEKRCRKNLPLCDLDQRDVTRIVHREAQLRPRWSRLGAGARTCNRQQRP